MRRSRFHWFVTPLLVLLLLMVGVMPASAPALSTKEAGPAVSKAVAPAGYPAIAAQAHASGKVTVEVAVDPSGDVTDARLIEVEGPQQVFRQPWYEMLAREWRFMPDQRMTQRKARIEFVFRFMPRGTPREKLGTVFAPPYQVEVREEEPERVTLPGH